ncbi:bacteriophage abortive infection AbiH family protein [Cupriavidus sp. UYPR2.512]|uniref:bacteriophage abortive infection AbiH family protein n=1 Tax=Cupriavidus sp. UYPR2.512 TaxID=1080187 RepID=UPI00037E38EC|nr:bacteriophage abortive infection AbiH family protein [Cupriavidus sp. UYPR2.512]UIF87920.1 bacteriophage abortive infection AbiH family protein [Cupriavidus necator]
MKLYVIGNGFDLHHGIRSSFGDFARYAQREHRDVADAVERYLPAAGADWWNLEAALAELDYEGVVDDCGIFVPSYAADDFKPGDFEVEVGRVADALSTGPRRAFSAWIHTVEIPDQSKRIALDPRSLFLSFNYTDTLSRLYSIPATQVWHVHGKVPCRPTEIVLGHAWKAADRRPTNPSTDSEDYDFWVDLGYRHLDEYFENTFKASERVIRDNAHRFAQLHSLSEVIVLGHSLAEVDY